MARKGCGRQHSGDDFNSGPDALPPMAGLACKLVPRWIGWATAVWNLAWLAGLVLARPWDIYFPILHLVMPVFIGAALILRRGREGAQEADLADIQVG
jgi:hypothetical protein